MAQIQLWLWRMLEQINVSGLMRAHRRLSVWTNTFPSLPQHPVVLLISMTTEQTPFTEDGLDLSWKATKKGKWVNFEFRFDFSHKSTKTSGLISHSDLQQRTSAEILLIIFQIDQMF